MREYSIIDNERSGKWLIFQLTESFIPIYDGLMSMNSEF